MHGDGEGRCPRRPLRERSGQRDPRRRASRPRPRPSTSCRCSRWTRTGSRTTSTATAAWTPGTPIAYTFTVTNPLSNGVTLSAVTVADPKVGPVSCPVSTLAAGASTTCTATYTLTQADVNAGAVNNTATANATSPPGTPDPAPVSDSASTPLAAAPSLTLLKSVDPTIGGHGGKCGDVLLCRDQHGQRRPHRGFGHGNDVLGHRYAAGDLVSGVDARSPVP